MLKNDEKRPSEETFQMTQCYQIEIFNDIM